MNLTVSTFNIRTPNDTGLQAFETRLPLCDEFFAEVAPDIVGLQEVKPEPYAQFREHQPGYEFIGIGRLADGTDEAVPIAWKKDRFEKIDGGTFWLSETPEVPGSRAFDTYWPRICTWVKLRVKDAPESEKPAPIFCVYNVHLDNLVVPAQNLGLSLAKERLLAQIKAASETGTAPFCAILLGDFNIEAGSEVLVNFDREVSGILTEHTAHLPLTYHGWQEKAEKIDYIYTTNNLVPTAKSSLYKKVNAAGTCISDHWPVVLDLKTE